MKITKKIFNTNPKVKIPIITFKGESSGPKGLITGGMHGDELNGMLTVKRFVELFEKEKLEKKMRGEITVIPLLNPTGFKRSSRRAQPDNSDLNRAFPGKRNGSFSQRFARQLMDEFVANADFVIDCHDAGSHSSLVPHTRVSNCKDKACIATVQNLGRVFGTELIIKREGKRGMLAIEAYKKFKKPVLTVEIGGAKHANKFLDEGVEGIKNILKYFKMISGKPKMPKKQFLLEKRFGIKAKRTGIIMLSAKLGSRVHKGDEVGTIYYPQIYKEEILHAPMCGVIFSLHDHQIIEENQFIYSVLETKQCHGKRKQAKEFTELKRISVEALYM